MIDLAFSLINYVPWEALDLDKEPLYFPSMFPLCLLGNEYTSGIGFGYRTIIPCYKIKDLYKRLLYLLGVTKKKPIIKPISNCEILSSDEELEKLLTVGRSKIRVKGIYISNNQNFTIKLKSWPGSFEKLKNKKQLQNDIENFDISDLSSAKVGTEVVFELNKQRNRELLFNRFVEKLDKFLNGTIPFDIIVTDSNWNVRRTSVDELLSKSYNNYFETTKVMLNSKIKDCNDLKEEYLALLKIRPVLSKCIKGKNQIIVDEIIKEIHEKTSVSEEMIKFLFSKYRINKLLTLNIDIEEIENKIKEYENNLNNINQYILNKYAEVVK
jgi:DNA gyrase/topoisomerase IV subunit A